MALHVTLGRASRVGLGAARTATSCAQATPSCPPPPPCRARSPERRHGSRVVCCAPPQGAPPPCARASPSCSLTCQDAVHENCVSSSQPCPAHVQPAGTQPSGCGCDQDPVARRLQLARSVRRAHYEWEAAWRAALAPAPPRCCAPYTLRGERECARATDGGTYVLREPSARPAPERCGPGRTPPPPRCVELAPDDACRIKSNLHIDPCAHRPRVIIEIDRSCSAPQPTCTPDCGVESYTPGGYAGTYQPGGSAGARTPGGCAGMHPPGYGVLGCASDCGARFHCRQASNVELLRARPLACQSNRYTHTSVALLKAGKCVKPASGGLEGILRSKEQLKEAGLGRVVTDAGTAAARATELPGGRLELCVPPGVQRVSVCVSLMGLASDSTDATSVMLNPCLLTKEIQKFTNSEDLKTGAQSAGRCSGPCSPCGPPAPRRCGPGPGQRAGCQTESKIETKRCSSTAAFLANTII